MTGQPAIPATCAPVGLRAYVTVFLLHEGHVLLLQRGPGRAFAPGLWTGVGGRVATGEYDDLGSAALRELAEETGLRPADVLGLRLRVALVQPEDGGLVLLAFFTGTTKERRQMASDEGILAWVPAADVWDLDMIGNARAALAVVLQGREGPGGGVWFGACDPAAGGPLRQLVMSPEPYPVRAAGTDPTQVETGR